MRTLRNKVVITICATVTAMAMEKAAQTIGTLGRNSRQQKNQRKIFAYG